MRATNGICVDVGTARLEDAERTVQPEGGFRTCTRIEPQHSTHHASPHRAHVSSLLSKSDDAAVPQLLHFAMAEYRVVYVNVCP
jgi:hypothetical protein